MLTSEFIDEGTHFKVVTSESDKKLSALPPAVYSLEVADDKSYNLKKQEPKFKEIGVIFGKSLPSTTEIVINHFMEEKEPTGLIAVGQKGCGKSKLCENICNVAITSLNIPVIVLKEALPRAVIYNVLKASAPCVLYIDEYEKLYKPDFKKNNNDTAPNEDELLTIFSDKNIGQVLTLITGNSKNDLSPFILDRPERFLFRIEYRGVSSDVVEEICDYYKLTKEIKEYIMDYAEDTRANLDTCITLAKNSTKFKEPKELKVLFDMYNIVKPKIWGWRIYTRSGQAEGIVAESDRKMLTIKIPDQGIEWNIHFDTYYKNFQYNRSYNCYILQGLGGESENATIGFIPTGTIKEEEEEPIKYFALQKEGK